MPSSWHDRTSREKTSIVLKRSTSIWSQIKWTTTIFEQAEIEVKYAGYIEKEKRNADKLKRP